MKKGVMTREGYHNSLQEWLDSDPIFPFKFKGNIQRGVAACFSLAVKLSFLAKLGISMAFKEMGEK